ncbi:MAG: energy-coupling factor transporter ATPase [Chloroflexi bacterium]|nr:energy-coupling factor transporter ATPase [Chloroflexota bacterium]
MNDAILRIESLHHTFFAGTPRAIPALRGIDLTIARGEYVAIVGHNGSGKSTLAKHLNGLLLPTQGEVWVKAWNTREVAHRRAIRATVGMVFQSPDNQIVATMVEEDVAFGPENFGIPREEIRTRVETALATVEMQAYRHRAPHLLSGGQKQRVAIAGVLALQPEVLVLDESTALLDPRGRAEVLRVMRQLHDAGVTIIAITHLMHEAAFADRVIVLNEGHIALQGTPREVFSQIERLRAWQLDAPEIAQLAWRVRRAHPDFPGDALAVKEFVEAVIQQRGKGAEGQGSDRFVPAPLLPRPPVRDNIIAVRDLAHTYLRGTPLESLALRGVTLDLAREHVTGIIGQTGSGKSTLIQHFNGLLRPQVGDVVVLGNDLRAAHVDWRALRRRVGLVFQFPEAQLFERFVGDDVAFAPWQMGMRGEALRARVREAMAVVGLDFDAFKDRPLYSLSGGERRRVALAGVLAMKPEILVLDEPTAGLDPRGHQDILARLMALRREWDTTLVIVSHNMEDIARLCDRVVVIADGRVEMIGAPREIFAQAKRLGELGLGVPQVTAVMRALREAGLPVRDDVLTLDEAEAEVNKVLGGKLGHSA